jgi:hypothetical protein
MTIAGAGLSETAGQQMWRDLMTKQLIPYVSEFRRQSIEEGLALRVNPSVGSGGRWSTAATDSIKFS